MHYRPEDPLFRKSKQVKDSHMTTLLGHITKEILKLLQQRGFLDSYGEIVIKPLSDKLFQDFQSIDIPNKASIAGRIAFGKNAGQKVTRLGSGFGCAEEIPRMKGRLCCSMNGFSIYAARVINTNNRKSREQLI